MIIPYEKRHLYTGGQKFGILTLIPLSLKTNKRKDLKTYV